MGNLQGKLPQSSVISLGLAAAGGVTEVFATAVLACADAEAQKRKEYSPSRQKVALLCNLFLQILASVFGNLFAPWFGPVSQVGTVFQSSQLLANMVIFGMVLGLETFTKDMKVGTYVVVVAVVLISFVGPASQEDQNAMELLAAWYSILWNIFVIIGMFGSYLFILLDVKKLREFQRIAVLAIARSTAFTVNLTTSRILVTNPSKAVFASSISLKIVSGAIMTHAIVVQSTSVMQAKFVPLNASSVILVNAFTGVILWEDWRVVVSWPSYACAFVLIFLGNYLLLGSVMFFDSSNESYGRRAVLERMGGRRHIFYTEHGREEDANEPHGRQAALDGREEESNEDSSNVADEESLSTETQMESVKCTSSPKWLMYDDSKKKIWMDVYGLRGQITVQGQSYRTKHIFALDKQENSENDARVRLEKDSHCKTLVGPGETQSNIDGGTPTTCRVLVDKSKPKPDSADPVGKESKSGEDMIVDIPIIQV